MTQRRTLGRRAGIAGTLAAAAAGAVTVGLISGVGHTVTASGTTATTSTGSGTSSTSSTASSAKTGSAAATVTQATQSTQATASSHGS